jgi:RNA polymerase sigma-70 factor (ECF subfamily)
MDGMEDDDVRRLLAARRYHEAFERLMELCQDKVFRLAVSILRDRNRAEEAAQESFLKLWQALPTYDGRAAPATWLYAIARNTCLATLRSERYRKMEGLDGPRLDPPAAPTVANEDSEVHELLERLPDVQRRVISLFYMEQRSVADVAQLLALPEGTVKSHLYRARRELARMMEGATR